MTPSEAKADLQLRLDNLGFDFARPALPVAWEAFRDHLSHQVDGAKDYVLVDFAICDYSFQPIRPAFTLDLCRQFGIHDERGNFQGYEQLHLMLYLPASPQLNGFKGSFFADDGEARVSLLKEVESSPIFQQAYSPIWNAALLMQWDV